MPTDEAWYWAQLVMRESAMRQLDYEQMMIRALWEQGFVSPSQESEYVMNFSPLSERTVVAWDITKVDPSPGRRLRAIASLLRGVDPIAMANGSDYSISLSHIVGPPVYTGGQVTYGEFAAMAKNIPVAYEAFSNLPYRYSMARTMEQYREYVEGQMPYTARDAELHPCLQDLAYEIGEDLHEACGAFDDPDIYYPGVDDGIEPVTDDHVRLVTWATQRELDRELRPPEGTFTFGTGLLPAVPLAELPWRIQRAFAERRRLRYQQWGLGRQQYEDNTFSIWDIPEDPDYYPRRYVRYTYKNYPGSDMAIWLQRQGQ